MSLFRNSVIVGGATFIVGSVLMEINVKQDGEPVGWWPYVGTFIAGALGFYLLGATNVVKVKNAEGRTPIENLMIQEGMISGDTWDMPKEMFPKWFDRNEGIPGSLKIDSAKVVRDGDSYSIVVKATQQMGIKNVYYRNSDFTKGPYPYTAKGWKNGYMKWVQVPQRGRGWATEVQANLGDFIDGYQPTAWSGAVKNAESDNFIWCAYCDDLITDDYYFTDGKTVHVDCNLEDSWDAEYKVTDGYEDCEVCAKTCDIKTDPLYDVQAGRICSDCHYLNEYGVEKGAESFSAESMCKYCKINDPENCMYFGPSCLDAESFSANGYRNDKTMCASCGASKLSGGGQCNMCRNDNCWDCLCHCCDDRCKHCCDNRFGAESFSAESMCSICGMAYSEHDYDNPNMCWEGKNAESPTDDELETWSERQNDGSMKVTIDEDGDSHTELTYKDGDLTDLKRFMAEVFEADRKARRRTTLTWARGIEQGFGTIPTYGDTHFAKPRPYDNDQYNYDSQYSNDNAYHIKGLPTGFHIHLWKAPKRGRYWQAYLKSPNNDEWKEEYDHSKRNLMKDVLSWYNETISEPEEKAVSPIQQLMISQGMISGEVQIHRIDTPATIQNRTDKTTGKKKKVEILPANIKYYFLGGDEALAPTLFATFEDDSLEFSNTSHIPEIVTNFCRGLIFIGVENAGSVRSVNRYNSERKQWVLSLPAWFQNMCAQEINFVHSEFGVGDGYEINDVEFLRFYGTWELGNEDKFLPATDSGRKLQVFQIAQYDDNGNQQWQEPRPSTQMKMYMAIINKYSSEDKPSTKDLQNGIFNLCVAKYQPQQYLNINNSMTNSSLYDNTLGFGIFGSFVEAGQLMCRRFKKK